MANNGEVVPPGYWFCGSCQNPNNDELASVKCTACGHERDSCCKEAGAPKPVPTGVYSGPLFESPSAWSPMSVSQYQYPVHQLDGHFDEHQSSIPQYEQYNNFSTLTGAGAPAAGSWTCECGASNSGLTPDFCPICGRRL